MLEAFIIGTTFYFSLWELQLQLLRVALQTDWSQTGDLWEHKCFPMLHNRFLCFLLAALTYWHDLLSGLSGLTVLYQRSTRITPALASSTWRLWHQLAEWAHKGKVVKNYFGQTFAQPGFLVKTKRFLFCIYVKTRFVPKHNLTFHWNDHVALQNAIESCAVWVNPV